MSSQSAAGQSFVASRASIVLVVTGVAACQPRPYTPPGYASVEAVSETEIIVGDAWPLPAVLMCPASEGRFPAAVIVGGSGAVDRDATVGPNKPFRDLALGLATLGICTLRYDKRLAAHRERVMAQVEQWTLRHNTIDDALQAIELLRARAEVDPGAVFAIGHSLGGYAMPRIAARAPELCGFVSMAGTPRHLREVFVPQARRFAAVDGKVTAEERAARRAQNAEERALALKTLPIEARSPDPSTRAHALDTLWSLAGRGDDFERSAASAALAELADQTEPGEAAILRLGRSHTDLAVRVAAANLLRKRSDGLQSFDPWAEPETRAQALVALKL